MTTREFKAFGVPPELHHRPINEGLLKLYGISPENSAEALLAHLLVYGSRKDEVWSVAVLDSEEPNITTTYGAVEVTDDVGGRDLANIVSGWIRQSKSVEWMPRDVLPLPSENPDRFVGHLLIRATQAEQ